MPEKVKTTVRKLREGASFSKTQVEIRFPPAGHLHVELRDASGHQPLGKRKVTFDVPEVGSVEKTTDAQGRFLEPDVPFADYELSVENGGKVTVAAVASKRELHVAAAPEARLCWVDLEIVDHRELAIPDGDATIDGHALRTHRGAARLHAPYPRGEGKSKLVVADREVEVDLPDGPRRTIVRLPEKKAEGES